MQEQPVDRVRQWLEQGRTRLDAFQELRNQGYDATVAERIVDEAATGGGIGRKTILAAVLVLLVIGGGVFTVTTILPAGSGDGGVPGGIDGVGSGEGAASNIAAVIERTGRSVYHVTYTVPRGNITPGINITAVTAYRDGGESRKDVVLEVDGTRRMVTAYDPVATSQTILCGDLGGGGQTCTTDHSILFVTALALTDLRTFRDDLDARQTTSSGNTTVMGRTCDRFTLHTTTAALYAAVSDQVRDVSIPSQPLTITACVDRETGYVADLTLREANASGTNPFHMTATTVNTTLASGTFTTPRPLALSAECAVDNATATLLALHAGETEATLTVGGSNRTVTLSQRYRPAQVPLGDVPSDTTTITAYADGQSVSAPCTPLS